MTQDEAFELLRRVGEKSRESQRRTEEINQVRRELLIAFDGQEGMGRTQMADALGIARTRVFALIKGDTPDSEFLADDAVEMGPEIFESLRDILDGAANEARTEGVEVDVAEPLWS